LECPDFSKSILPALVFRLGFATLHCTFSPIQDVRMVEKGYFVSFWVGKFALGHFLFLRLALFPMFPQFKPFFIALALYGFERICQSLVCGIQHATTRI
jgi:hypothetical protein